MTEEKILFVDDEPHVLQSMKRQFRKRFALHTAGGGEEALALLKENGPFAVVVSDMRMPGMNGVELLSRVKDLYPDTVRIMLTGNADQDTAIEAVNTGQIFRFLTKPCPTSLLVTSLALALHQYRLITAERELLQKTLKGAVSVLAELLSQANPTAFSASLRVKKIVVQLADRLGIEEGWQFELAALVSQIGCVSLPSDIINKVYVGLELNDEEAAMWEEHPLVAARMLEKIPRLERPTRMVALQQLAYDRYTPEIEDQEYEEVILGAQMLKAVIDYDILLNQGEASRKALEIMQRRNGRYNPALLDALQQIKIDYADQVLVLRVREVAVGMIADEDVVAKNGALIIPKGQKITWPVLKGLSNFARQVGIMEPLRMRQDQG